MAFIPVRAFVVVLLLFFLSPHETRAQPNKFRRVPLRVSWRYKRYRWHRSSDGFRYATYSRSELQTDVPVVNLRGGSSPLQILTNQVATFARGVEGSRTKSWILLVLCIFNETIAVTLTKMAQERHDLGLLGVAIVMYTWTVLGFTVCLNQIDVSIAYAVWSALGTSFVTVAGILLFGEKCNAKKLACLSCIIFGVVGLNMPDEH